MVKFKTLWDNHPTVESFFDDFPCKKNGVKAFENQCAIRLGVALEKSGVNLKSFKGARCWHKHNPAHVLRAEELANWLKTGFSPFQQLTSFEAKDGFSKIDGKSGIVFFKDYYGSNDQGDHIDLWNGSRLTRRTTWFEFTFRDGSHFEDATVWFWPVA